MWVMPNGEVFDPNLEFLKDCVSLVDRRLDQIEHSKCPDPDSFGLYDEADHLVGFGFVACQTYMAATAASLKTRKQKALELGPRHGCGKTIAELINAAANYWKHNHDWDFGDEDRRRDKTLDVLDSLDIPDSSYLLVQILWELVHPRPAIFASLVPLIEDWREATRANGS